MRRSKGHAESVIRTGKLTLNMDARSVEADGRRLHVTGKEYSILELLSLRKGTTLTKEMFLDHLYGGMDEPELKIIDVFICKLRKKLAEATGGEHYIETVWGRGYVLKDPSRWAWRCSRQPSPEPPVSRRRRRAAHAQFCGLAMRRPPARGSCLERIRCRRAALLPSAAGRVVTRGASGSERAALASARWRAGTADAVRGTPWSRWPPAMPSSLDDILRTGPDSRLQIVCNDGLQIASAPAPSSPCAAI